MPLDELVAYPMFIIGFLVATFGGYTLWFDGSLLVGLPTLLLGLASCGAAIEILLEGL